MVFDTMAASTLTKYRNELLKNLTGTPVLFPFGGPRRKPQRRLWYYLLFRASVKAHDFARKLHEEWLDRLSSWLCAKAFP